MDTECQVWRWFKQMELAFEQHGIGAQIDEFLALCQPRDDGVDLRMDEGFAAGDGHDRCTTFLRGFEAFLRREAFAEDFGWILDLPATSAFQITTEQWL